MCIEYRMRQGKILNLKWDRIRNGLIYLKETKTKNPGEIPINDDLRGIFSKIRKDQGLTSPYVFTYCKRNISRVDKSSKAALTRAGIEDFTFHDFRHRFSSHLVMRGASLKKVQELLGHKSISMTMR